MVPRGWRAYRRTSRRAAELSAYLNDEAINIEKLSAQLNEHGFQLERTMSELAPKLEMIGIFLRRPLVAATIPWILRRLMGRPYRRRP